MTLKTNQFALIIGVFSILYVTTCDAGNKWSVGKNVSSSDQVSMDRIDHNAWDSLLRKYVDTNGNVDYTSWQRSTTDTRKLDEYLNTMSHASTTARATKSAQLAFWINVYNAVTIKGILREYPTTSIRNHTAKLLGYNI